jgi:ABC-type glycerol-3-phosphate transport system substrate-binding protein
MTRKRISRRAFLKSAGIAAAGAGLAACAPNPTPAPTAVPAATAVPATAAPAATAVPATVAPQAAGGKLSLWGWTTATTRSRDANGKDILVQRVKEDLGIDLEMSLVEQNDMGAKLKAALPAGTGPDVLATDFDVMGPYWSFAAPLNALGTAEWGANWKKDQFTDSAVSEMDLVGDIAGKPGEAMFLPGNMQVLGWLIYWIDDLQKNGVDPSKLSKWDDFTAACDTLKKAGLVPLIGGNHPATLVDWYQSLVEVAAPGKLDQVERGHGKFNDADMTDAFNLIAKVHNDYMQPGVLGIDAGPGLDSFHAHKGAMSGIFTGTPWFGFLNSDNKDIRAQMNGKYGTFLLPGSKGLAAMDAGIAMVDGTKNKDAAWAYMKWLSTGKGGAHLSDEGEPMGAKALKPAPKGTDFDKNLGAPLYAALQSTNNKFRRILCPDVYQSLTKVIPGVISKQITAQDAAAEVQDAFDKNCGKWVK